MQSSSQSGESSSTQPLMQDSGRPGDAGTARPEGARFEETRRPHPMVRRTERGLGATPVLTVNRAGRCRIRDGSETPSEGAEDGARMGATPALTVIRAGRCRIRGGSETPSEGAEDGARIGGNPALTVNRARGCGIRGNSETPSEGAEDGTRIGGNPGTHCQPSRRVRDSRRLGASFQG